MNQEKQCVKCKKRFDAGLRYCPKCGTYWKQGKQSQGWTGGILRTEQMEGIAALNARQVEEVAQAANTLPERYIICERCKKEIPVVGETLPDFCCHCNTMVDGRTKIETSKPAAEIPDNHPKADEGDASQEADEKPECLTKKGALFKKDLQPQPDNSTISFVWHRRGESKRLREPDIEKEITLGTEGNYEAEFFSNPSFSGLEALQAEINHSSAGWYIKARGANVRHNNEPISANNKHFLVDEDWISLGDCTLQVEIRARMK